MYIITATWYLKDWKNDPQHKNGLREKSFEGHTVNEAFSNYRSFVNDFDCAKYNNLSITDIVNTEEGK